MSPDCSSLAAGDKPVMISVVIEEVIVDEDGAAEPVGAPTPCIPASPSAKAKTDVETDTKAKAIGGVKKRRIKAVDRRPPHKEGIVNRHVNHIRLGRLDYYDVLSLIVLVFDSLLRR